MNVKPYSIGFALFAALLLNGCNQKPSTPPLFDLTEVLSSDFPKVETLLGKSKKTEMVWLSKTEIKSSWHQINGNNILVMYDRDTKKSDHMLWSRPYEPPMEQAYFLEMGNLQMGDSRYTLKFILGNRETSKCVAVEILAR